MIIHKRLITGEIQVSYGGEVVAHDDTLVVIHATWERADRDLGYTIFKTGDRFTEYFYSDQYFNIMQVDDAVSGQCRGWYCNISRPAIFTADSVEYVDLYLDLWAAADGTLLVLDEEEFAEADLDESTRQMARAGLAEVMRWAQIGLGPFAALHRFLDDHTVIGD